MRLAARHLACVFLLIAAIGPTQGHVITPSTAGGRYIHALLAHEMAPEAGDATAATRLPGSDVPLALSAEQRWQATRVHAVKPPAQHSIDRHAASASLA